MLSREGRISGRACAPRPHRRTTSMAANAPSAGSGGSRGIAGDATASGKAFMPPPTPALAAV